MRTHTQIIMSAGDGPAFAKAIGAPYNRVRQWIPTDSIPAPYWSAVVEAGLATLEELATAAARRRPETQAAA